MQTQTSLRYVGMPLNRHSAEREAAQWVEDQQYAVEARFLAIRDNDHLATIPDEHGGNDFEVLYLAREELLGALEADCQWVYLGHEHTTPVFCVDLDGIQDEVVDDIISAQSEKTGRAVEFIDLRKLGPVLPTAEAATLGYARGINIWHQNHQFCGRCGTSTAAQRGGHMRKCLSQTCGKETYPRIDPAVIMLVERLAADGTRYCLLGRHKGLPRGIYSTLAGYVDPGESMEEAVAREVMEESGIAIQTTQYIASQPWPFPSSLMVGFRAQTEQINIDRSLDELEDVAWFTAEEVRQFSEYDKAHDNSSDNANKALPRKDSIARILIDMWLTENS